jgi:hypothetical protein
MDKRVIPFPRPAKDSGYPPQSLQARSIREGVLLIGESKFLLRATVELSEIPKSAPGEIITFPNRPETKDTLR